MDEELINQFEELCIYWAKRIDEEQERLLDFKKEHAKCIRILELLKNNK